MWMAKRDASLQGQARGSNGKREDVLPALYMLTIHQPGQALWERACTIELPR
jgi:hypothetical protein